MSKELETLERIGAEKLARGELIRNDDKLEPYIAILKSALQRLEAIDNAKSTEALECLEKIAEKVDLVDKEYYWEVRNAYVKVEQALIKSQEQEKEIDRLENQCLDVLADNIRLEKVFEILKSKDVLYTQIKYCKSVDEYNHLIEFTDFDSLAPEEFDLLKRYFK